MPQGAIAIADTYSAPFLGVVQMTAGTVYQQRRAFGYVCTTAGNLTVTFPDASTITVPIVTASGAFQSFPFAVTSYTLSGGAVGTFWNLK